SSLGRYYNSNVKGAYDCRLGGIPNTPTHDFGTQEADSRGKVGRSLATVPRETRRFAACEDGHWIESITSDGKIIKLEDGSVWQVDDVDAVDSSLWLPASEIIACDDKLISTDDKEKVSASRLR